MINTGYIACKKCYISRWPGRLAQVLFSVIFLAFTVNASAEEEEDAEFRGAAAIQAEEQTAVPEQGILATIDGSRDYLSEKVVSYSKSIDQFFGDERYFQEHNESVIQLEMNELMKQSGNHTFAIQGQAKIDLPAAQKRFRLVLEANPEQKSTDETRKDLPTQTKDARKPDQYSAALRIEREEISYWRLSAESGALLQFPLDPFIKTRARYAIPVLDWRLSLAESVFWFSTIGLGETTQFDMEKVLSKPVLFRATSTVTCLESPQKCDLRQDLSVFHTLNERAVMLYQASVIGEDKPALQETDYILLMRYRYRLHREWVFFEISPQIFFPRTDHFKLNALLNLRLEFLFGATK